MQASAGGTKAMHKYVCGNALDNYFTEEANEALHSPARPVYYRSLEHETTMYNTLVLDQDSKAGGNAGLWSTKGMKARKSFQMRDMLYLVPPSSGCAANTLLNVHSILRSDVAIVSCPVYSSRESR